MLAGVIPEIAQQLSGIQQATYNLDPRAMSSDTSDRRKARWSGVSISQRHLNPNGKCLNTHLRPEASDDSPRDGPVGLRLPEKGLILKGTALRDVLVAFRLGRCVGPPRPCGPTL